MIRIYGYPGSTCSRKVICTCHELGVPFELEVVDLMKDEHLRPEHLALHPFGKIPVIDDAGLLLYESHAIIQYLDERQGGTLMPSDPRERARARQWMSVEQSYVASAAMTQVFHHLFGIRQEPSALQQAEDALGRAFDVLAANLATRPYLAGDTFSLADITFLPYVEYLMKIPTASAIRGRPSLIGWWSRCAERPSWRRTVEP